MPAKTIFAVVSDALKKELEPLGFHIHARTNNGEIIVTDVSDPDNRFPWIVTVRPGQP